MLTPSSQIPNKIQIPMANDVNSFIPDFEVHPQEFVYDWACLPEVPPCGTKAGARNWVTLIRFFQHEFLNLTARLFRRLLKDQSFLMRLKKTPFWYPITDVNHPKKFE
jgi:hypothetical protein